MRRGRRERANNVTHGDSHDAEPRGNTHSLQSINDDREEVVRGAVTTTDGATCVSAHCVLMFAESDA
jgi:hypothetical protein